MKRHAPSLAILFALAAVACATPGAHRRDGDVYLMPLGEVPASLVRSLTRYCSKTFEIVCVATPEIRLDARMVDQKRRQLVAEDLLVVARAAAPLVSDSHTSLVIGLTATDMYTEKEDWRFAFAVREGSRSAVISYSRMDDANYNLPANPDRLEARIRKMIAKTIGLQLFQLKLSDDPRSVLYRAVFSVPDLDAIDESTVRTDILVPAGKAN